MENFNKKLIQIRTELYEDTQLTFQRLVDLQKEMKDSFNKRKAKLLEDNGYLKKIVIPQKYIKLWKHRDKLIQIPLNWRYIVGAPFIYGMFFPSVIFHISIEIYQQVCFRLYGIPLVNLREYFINDRQLLSWLNPWEKINCIYCSYVNNLIRYSAEIGGRTERYWCPIKYYRRVEKQHSQYSKFMDGGNANPQKMRKEWEELRNFSDLS